MSRNRVARLRVRGVRIGVGMLLAASTFVPVTRAHEQQVPLDRVPKPVLDAVQARFANAHVTGAEIETENGRMVYEITLLDDGRNVDVISSPAGELLAIEKAVETTALPSTAATALQSRYPGATYRSVEQVIELDGHQGRPAYEVELETADGRTLEIKVMPDGAIVTGEDKHKDKNRNKDKHKPEHKDDDDDGA